MRGFHRGRFGRVYHRPLVRPRVFHWRPVWRARPLYWGFGLLLFPGLCIASMFVMSLLRLLVR
jgi:hypothetical protein